ncbi:hypothetical protein SRHO_G00088960 [Serrasalmus rhombeus]
MLLRPLLRRASTQRGRRKESPPLQPAVGRSLNDQWHPLFPAPCEALSAGRSPRWVERLLSAPRTALGSISTAGSSRTAQHPGGSLATGCSSAGFQQSKVNQKWMDELDKLDTFHGD